MKNPRSSKRQLEQDRRAKAERKRQRRLDRVPTGDEPAEAGPVADEGEILDALAEVHAAYAAGSVTLEEFESTRQELTSRLHVD